MGNKRFAVAWTPLMDNVTEIQFINAENPVGALLMVARAKGFTDLESSNDDELSTLEAELFNGDVVATSVEVPEL